MFVALKPNIYCYLKNNDTSESSIKNDSDHPDHPFKIWITRVSGIRKIMPLFKIITLFNNPSTRYSQNWIIKCESVWSNILIVI